MNQVDVTIMGQGYRLGCPDGGEATLRAAVHDLDREMCAIRDAGRIRARERIAVLAALNFAYALVEGQQAQAAQAAQATGAGSVAPTVDLDALLRRLDAALDQPIAAGP